MRYWERMTRSSGTAIVAFDERGKKKTRENESGMGSGKESAVPPGADVLCESRSRPVKERHEDQQP